MKINKIRLTDFRNLRNTETEFGDGVNVILGDNAQGKTNILEAVYYLAAGRSFRTRFDREIINFDSDYARIIGNVENSGRNYSIEYRFGRGQRKKKLINGVDPKKLDADRIFAAVCFTPEDLELVRAGNAERRSFMNNAISNLKPKYAALLTEYNRLYAHKSRILKDHEEKPELLKVLPEYSARMAQMGAQIIGYRAHFVQKLKAAAKNAQFELTNGVEELELSYTTVSTVRDALGSIKDIYEDLLKHLQSHANAEIASGMCLSGPHKDGLEVKIGGREVKNYGSQGQTRTAALALKLAELDICRCELGSEPVLLLDDVLSELDASRQNMLLNRMGNGQVIITACGGEKITSAESGRVINIKNGEII